ncbi:MAG TPA: hypothetical protein VN749_04125 [Candidatus Eisenbacteria bacterium]|jgi:hypothetical protein|nr:hypothetical protein [Candidatus Eisenbacteria bacterium]
MSTKKQHGHEANGAPMHSDVTFEPRDIDIGTIARYLVYLAITIVVALVICVPILNVLTKMVAEQDTPMPAIRAEMSQKQRDEQQLPPNPRLQGVPGHESDPQQDMRNKIAADTRANETLTWVDKDKGIAQIPVADAMKIIAEKAAVPAAIAEKKQ